MIAVVIPHNTTMIPICVMQSSANFAYSVNIPYASFNDPVQRGLVNPDSGDLAPE